MSAHIIPPVSLNSLSTAILTEMRNFMRFSIVLILCKRGPSLSTDPCTVPSSTYFYISYLKPFILTVLSLASQCTVSLNIVWNACYLNLCLPLSECVKVFLCVSGQLCSHKYFSVCSCEDSLRRIYIILLLTHALKSETPPRPLCSACLEWEHPAALRAKHPVFWQGRRMWLI